MIYPVEKKSAGLVAHAIGEDAGKTVSLEKSIDTLEKKILGFVAKRPVKLILGLVS
jgi:hypothetical protein